MYVKFHSCSSCQNRNNCCNQENYEKLDKTIQEAVNNTGDSSFPLFVTVNVKCNLYHSDYGRSYGLND